MNWLELLPLDEKKRAVALLVDLLINDGRLQTVAEGAVEVVLLRYGFSAPHSASSVTHNIMASQTEQKRHTARMLALSTLINEAKHVVNMERHRDGSVFVQLENAIAAVEREFKP
jgi:hypothetical protein